MSRTFCLRIILIMIVTEGTNPAPAPNLPRISANFASYGAHPLGEPDHPPNHVIPTVDIEAQSAHLLLHLCCNDLRASFRRGAEIREMIGIGEKLLHSRHRPLSRSLGISVGVKANERLSVPAPSPEQGTVEAKVTSPLFAALRDMPLDLMAELIEYIEPTITTFDAVLYCGWSSSATFTEENLRIGRTELLF